MAHTVDVNKLNSIDVNKLDTIDLNKINYDERKYLFVVYGKWYSRIWAVDGHIELDKNKRYVYNDNIRLLDDRILDNSKLVSYDNKLLSINLIYKISKPSKMKLVIYDQYGYGTIYYDKKSQLCFFDEKLRSLIESLNHRFPDVEPIELKEIEILKFEWDKTGHLREFQKLHDISRDEHNYCGCNKCKEGYHHCCRDYICYYDNNGHIYFIGDNVMTQKVIQKTKLNFEYCKLKCFMIDMSKYSHRYLMALKCSYRPFDLSFLILPCFKTMSTYKYFFLPFFH